MRSARPDLGALSALKPELVRRYLQSQAWEPSRRLPRSEIWTKTYPVGEVEVSLPRDPRLRDYAVQLYHLLETLSLVEERPTAQVHRDITASLVDVPSFRLLPVGIPSGSVPLAEGTRAFSSVRDLMVSAAYRAALLADGRPVRPVEPGRKPNEVYDFLGRSRLGPTGAGSYILTIEVPLDSPEPEQLRLDSQGLTGGLPLARRVCLALYDGVAAAHGAAVAALRTRDSEPFDLYAQQNGLTANVCESLSELSSNGRLPFEMRVAWANSLPADRATAPLHFDPELIEALQAGAAYLRAHFGQQGVALVGTIARMVRTPVSGPGTILVVGSPEDEPQRTLRVQVDLGAEDYHRAGTAHLEGHEVRIRGDLVREGSRWWLRGVQEFRTTPVDGGE